MSVFRLLDAFAGAPLDVGPVAAGADFHGAARTSPVDHGRLYDELGWIEDAAEFAAVVERWLEKHIDPGV